MVAVLRDALGYSDAEIAVLRRYRPGDGALAELKSRRPDGASAARAACRFGPAPHHRRVPARNNVCVRQGVSPNMDG
jgi:hypothetical protein